MPIKKTIQLFGNNVKTSRGKLIGLNFYKKTLPNGVVQLKGTPNSKRHRIAIARKEAKKIR
jgi:hypothetical protein